MSARPVVRTTRHDRVLEVCLDRPPANAVNGAVSAALYEAFRTLQEDDELSVGLLTAAGERIFCAGWDLKEAAAAGGAAFTQGPTCPGGFAGITEYWGLLKPVVVAVNGAAVGGGFELVLACDVVIASEQAQFWVPDMQRGFLPDAGAIQHLPRRLPYNVAMELLLTGRRMDAAEAKHWGLVHAVVPAGQLLARARALAQTIAEGAPLALQALKEVVPAIHSLPIREAFARTKPGRSGLPAYERMLLSEDAVEGPLAFAEKRKPRWKGR